MVTERYPLVVGTDDDVESIELALVVPLGDRSLPVAPLLEVKHQLIVTVTDALILPVERCPDGIGGTARLPFQLQV